MKIQLSIILLAIISSAAIAQSTELKYDLEKGKTYRVKSTMIQDQQMTVQGMERNTETKNTTFISLKMLDSKPDFFIAEVRFDTIQNSVSMPPMELSSANEGDIKSENPVDVINTILHRLSNSTMVVRLDYSGKVLDIMNHNIIAENILHGTDSLKGQSAMAKGQVEMMVAKDALIGMIEGVTAYLPNAEVKKGSKWETSIVSTNGGIGMTVNSDYVIKELSKDEAMVEGDVIIEPASTEPTLMNGAEITNELRGLGKTSLKIDPATGWIIQSSSKIQLSGNMIVKAPGQNMTIPIESQMSGETKMIK